MAHINPDKNLTSKGYTAYRPEDVQQASVARNPGYLEYISSVAHKPGDGLWYLNRTQIRYVKSVFLPGSTQVSDVTKFEEKEPNDEGPKELVAVRKMNWRIIVFFDLDRDCPFPGCKELRDAYKEEITRLEEDCPPCEKTRIRNKYISMIKSQIEEQYGTI